MSPLAAETYSAVLDSSTSKWAVLFNGKQIICPEPQGFFVTNRGSYSPLCPPHAVCCSPFQASTGCPWLNRTSCICDYSYGNDGPGCLSITSYGRGIIALSVVALCVGLVPFVQSSRNFVIMWQLKQSVATSQHFPLLITLAMTAVSAIALCGYQCLNIYIVATSNNVAVNEATRFGDEFFAGALFISHVVAYFTIGAVWLNAAYMAAKKSVGFNYAFSLRVYGLKIAIYAMCCSVIIVAIVLLCIPVLLDFYALLMAVCFIVIVMYLRTFMRLTSIVEELRRASTLVPSTSEADKRIVAALNHVRRTAGYVAFWTTAFLVCFAIYDLMPYPTPVNATSNIFLYLGYVFLGAVSFTMSSYLDTVVHARKGKRESMPFTGGPSGNEVVM